MALPIGILLLILGTVAFVAWLPFTFQFLQGMVSFSLLLWGVIAVVIGIAQKKAKKELKTAFKDGEAAPLEAKPEVEEEAPKAAVS